GRGAGRVFAANDLREFMAYARANPDKLNMAHAGVGSITHFTCLMLNSMLGIRPALVPFTGSAPAINALVAGQVDYICDPTPDILQQIHGGTVKVHGIASPTRSSTLPDIPTTIEAAVPGLQDTDWARVV